MDVFMYVICCKSDSCLAK